MNVPFVKKYLANKQVCNLKECLEGRKAEEESELPQILDFKGPVRVVLVDPPDERDSEQRRTASGFISLANMMIAANTMVVILFSLSFNFDKLINFHIILCTVGYQFCFPLSILVIHPLFGPAGPMDASKRVSEHIKMLIIATICMISGAYFGFQYKNTKNPKALRSKIAARLPINDHHTNTGIATLFFFSLSILFALILIILKKIEHIFKINEPCHPRLPSLYNAVLYVHRYLGLLTMLLSNVCFILGICTPSMQIVMFFHGYLVPTIAIVLFTLFYTVVMFVFPGWHYTE